MNGSFTSKISPKARSLIPDIDWRKAVGMRDMLVHAYFGIDNDILWDVVQNKVPELLKATESFLNKN